MVNKDLHKLDQRMVNGGTDYSEADLYYVIV